MATGQNIGQNQGKGSTDADRLALFLKVFGGEVLTAFARRSVTMDKHMVRTIQNGKSAQFPVMGRTKGYYLKAGENLDDKRQDIKHSEKTITIDGLLTSDVLIFDIDDAMNHYDVRSEYSAQLGEALAIAADGAVFAEMAVLCNPVSGKDENITGLGSATVLKIGTASALADQAALGTAILKGLTTARAKLTKNYVPASDRRFYTTPENYSAILAALMPNSANYSALIDPETGNIRNVMGFEVIEVPHLTVGGAGDDAAGTNQKHAFPATSSTTVPVALDNVVGLFNHRSAVGTVKLKDMALERARRANLQADQIIGKYAMGHGGLRPEAAGALVFG
ncbi:phage capsid protein [Pseudomonas oryzihabitans]|uniref:phage major capsid protein n=1 Tax=Pseudomonas oryzihabitans TaxID=47885 RepID=UPI0014755391|nr:phage capsid protein [Pseudomonas oryzihabitans]NMZ63419.1 phage capsid protein [Pseudomonas oryzihabitans]